MQENVRFFDTKLHKNACFSVCKVHKIAKSVISIGQKDYVKKSLTNIKVRTESARETEVVSFLRKNWRKKRHKVYKKDTSLYKKNRQGSIK